MNSATNYALAAGHRAKAIHTGAFVWADSQDADFVSSGANQFLIRATGGVGIGVTNPAVALDVAGTVKATALVVGSSTVVTNLNADLLDGLTASNFWQLGGNSGTAAGVNFLGTTDNQPLEFKVNGMRALRLENIGYGAPNVIGGSPRNFVGGGVMGATVAGGGATNYMGNAYTNSVLANFGAVGGGRGNAIGASSYDGAIGGGNGNYIGNDSGSATIAGGRGNAIGTNSAYTTIGGGYNNNIAATSSYASIAGGTANNIGASSYDGAIGGGNDNNIAANSSDATIAGGAMNDIGTNSDYSVIGGGYDNNIGMNSDRSTISGGSYNNIAANAPYATIAGGYNNFATNYAFASGRRAKANHTGAFVWADSTDADFASTAANQFLIRASGGVGIGTTSPQSSLHIDQPSGEAAICLTSGGISWPLILHMTATSDFHITNGNAARLTIKANGNVGIGRNPTTYKLEVEGDASKATAGSWQANSDRRIKRDIEPVRNALGTLDKVRLVSFRYTDDYRAQHPVIEDRRYLNVVAQEFAEVFPEAVKESGDRLPNGEPVLSVDAYPLTVYSAAAVQELNQIVQRKEARIAELEKDMAELKSLVRTLAAKVSGGEQ